MSLNLDSARRQAIGSQCARSSDSILLAQELLNGNLRLPPHPDWRGDFSDWTADPYSDRNWQFQHHTLRWLNPLLWAAVDGNEQARAMWLETARSWCQSNIPASKAGSKFAWIDMADGNRAIQLSIGAPLINRSEENWYVDALKYHREWLLDESHIKQHNHGLHQNMGLFVVSSVLNDLESQVVAFDRLVAQYTSSFDEQGANDEGSAAYLQLNMKWWGEAWERIDAEGLQVPPVVNIRRGLASHALAQIAHPDGSLPQIGDSARGRVLSGLGLHSDFVASQGGAGRAPDQVSFVLDRGFAISRSGWGRTRALHEESQSILRFGEDLGSHSHDDRGGLTVFSRGRPWLVDAGFYSYQKDDPFTAYLRTREAHNVVSVVGESHEPSKPVELTRWEFEPEFHDYHLKDHGYAGFDLQRRVTYLPGPDCWVVWDSEKSDRKVSLAQRWLVDTAVFPAMTDGGFELRDKGRSLTMTWLAGDPKLKKLPASDNDHTGWIGTRWRTKKPGTLLTATTFSKRKNLIVLIAPCAPFDIGLVRSRLTTGGVLSFAVVRNSESWDIVLNRESVSVTKR